MENIKRETYLLLAHVLGMNKFFDIATIKDEESNILMTYKGKAFLLTLTELPDKPDENYQEPQPSQYLIDIANKYKKN